MATRNPTAYQEFLRDELLKIKANNPNIDHKTAFKEASQRWHEYGKAHASGQTVTPPVQTLSPPTRTAAPGQERVSFVEQVIELMTPNTLKDDDTKNYDGERIDLLIRVLKVFSEVRNVDIRNELDYYSDQGFAN